MPISNDHYTVLINQNSFHAQNPTDIRWWINFTPEENTLKSQHGNIIAYLNGMLYGSEDFLIRYIATHNKYSPTKSTVGTAGTQNELFRIELIKLNLQHKHFIQHQEQIGAVIYDLIFIAAKNFIGSHQFIERKLENLKELNLLDDAAKKTSIAYGTARYLYEVIVPLYRPEVSTFLAKFLGLKVAGPAVIIGALATSYSTSIGWALSQIPPFVFPVIPVAAVSLSYAGYSIYQCVQQAKEAKFKAAQLQGVSTENVALPTSENLNHWNPEYRPLTLREQEAFATRWGWGVMAVTGILFNALRVVLENWISEDTADMTRKILPAGISDAFVLLLTYQITRHLYLAQKIKQD